MPLPLVNRTGLLVRSDRRVRSLKPRVGQHRYTISLNIEAEDRVPMVARRIHEDRLAQPPTDRGQEVAEGVQPFLSLQLPEVHVEVDLLGGAEAKDRRHSGHCAHPKVRLLTGADDVRWSGSGATAKARLFGQCTGELTVRVW